MENIANEYVTTLAESISDSDTEFDLTDAPPAALSGGNFRLRIGAPDGTPEYVLVGTVSGSTVSDCTRGVEGTTAATWSSGQFAAQVITVAGLDDRIMSRGGGGSILREPNFESSAGWTNVGSSPTIDFGSTVAGHCYITKTPPNTTTDAYFGAYRAWTPSAGQKRRVMLAGWIENAATQAVGMFVADSASGKALLWEVYGSVPGVTAGRLHWRAMSSLTGSVNDADTGIQAGFSGSHNSQFGPTWLEIEYTSASSYQLRWSLDGFRFITVVANKSPDSAFTPDSWGIHVYTYGSTTPPQGLFQQWEDL